MLSFPIIMYWADMALPNPANIAKANIFFIFKCSF